MQLSARRDKSMATKNTKSANRNRARRIVEAVGLASRPPQYIWADCDPDAPMSVRWAFYRSKADQRGNRPDLKAIKLRVSLA